MAPGNAESAGPPVAGVQVVILEDNSVFLQLRPFPLGWELPGGHVAPGEDPLRAAIRETREETGFAVSSLAYVGAYDWKGLRHARDAVYLATSHEGEFHRSFEAVAGRFFPIGGLPRQTFPWIPRRILDAVRRDEGAQPVTREQTIGPLHVALFGASWLAAPAEGILRRVSR